ncbi:hypothetical protein TNIN_194171 [Trichonephila inaurata madagascariensis]|uniref:Uncharacterized protein n=1 Tax=Trichonephila inaurata madagascariensis TaxID=2747483 RepID=A0A8X7C0G9_9ARAC|nr:hypothetical protein TNIN_194171 [Trichonephila inaurata madagascariensis]
MDVLVGKNTVIHTYCSLPNLLQGFPFEDAPTSLCGFPHLLKTFLGEIVRNVVHVSRRLLHNLFSISESFSSSGIVEIPMEPCQRNREFDEPRECYVWSRNSESD